MPKCKCCGKPADGGVVLHSECYDQMKKAHGMTDHERAVVMAFTGTVMLAGESFDIFHKYVENLMGRPVFTHELPDLAPEIKERSRAEFISLCR